MRRGMSLIEVLIAAAVLSTVLLGLAMFQASTVRVNQTERDRSFAVQKSIQIMEEILANQTRVGTSTTAGIDALDDGSGYSYMLTADPSANSPDLAISGNPKNGGRFRFVRHISVAAMANDRRARVVTVTVYLASRSTGNPTPQDVTHPLASVTNIVKSDVRVSLPTQLFDLYVIKLENLASWWGESNMLENSVQHTIQAMQSNNPGFLFRTHWIRHLSYGRDNQYAPYVNKAQPLSSDTLPWVYIYPGNRDNSTNCMEPTVLQGQELLDGNLTNTISDGSGYTYADQFNHALRAPEEQARYATAVGGELTLRLMLDAMASGQLKNALILNLHTENIPIPPVRNYSDAAKVPQVANTQDAKTHFGIDPENASNITDGSRARLVTHPLNLQVKPQTTGSYDATDTVDLQVYPYLDSGYTTEPAGKNYHVAQVVLRNVDDNLYHFITSGGDKNKSEKNIEIDVMDMEKQGASNNQWQPYNSGTKSTMPDGYHWVRIWPDDQGEALDTSLKYSDDLKNTYKPNVKVVHSKGHGYNDGDITIQLEQVPYTHDPEQTGSKYGILSGRTLHGFNYFPDPNLDDLSVQRASSTADEPRNTARFRIRFKLNAAQTVQVDTAIGDNPEILYHSKPNLSSTFCWVGSLRSNPPGTGTNAPPPTELYQYLGDPRNNPYQDVRDAEGYNRCFANLTSNAYGSGSFSGNSFAHTSDGWDGARIDSDVPRQLQLWRTALFNANAELINPGGYSFYYCSTGGEFSETLSNKPYTGGGGTTARNEMGAGSVIYLIANAAKSWYSKPWLGELYPDDQWSTWSTSGNLAAGSYRRTDVSTLTSWPGGASYARTKTMGGDGCIEFFNGGSSSGKTFTHKSSTGTGTATSQGNTMSADYKLTTTNQLDVSRPFRIDGTVSSFPDDWNYSDMSSWRNVLEWGLNPAPVSYFSFDGDSSYYSVAPIIMRHNSTDAAYVLMMGTDKTSVQADADAQARVALMAAMESLFDNAKPTYTVAPTARTNEAVKLLPVVHIDSPADSSQISSNVAVSWSLAWNRWDSTTYSSQVSSYGSNPYKPYITYNMKYSPNGGATWKYVQDDTLAATGVYDSSPSHIISGTSYTWHMGGLPDGDYLLRLEGYRMQSSTVDGGYSATHYAYHQILVTK